MKMISDLDGSAPEQVPAPLVAIRPTSKKPTKKTNMGFIKKLFKRKPGGTFAGNLIRGVANNLSGGALGNGYFKIPHGATAPQVSNDQAKAAAIKSAQVFNQEVGQTGKAPEVTGLKVPAEMQEMMKKYWWIAALGAAVVYVNPFKRRGLK